MIEVRPLTFPEIRSVLRLARKTGWYGNADLINAVLDTGVQGGIAALGDGVYTASVAAREVWILTLRNLVARAKAISRGADTPIKLPRIRRYRFKDLATPGMLVHLANKCAEINVEGYMRETVEACVAEVGSGDRILHGEEREAMIANVFDWLAEQILTLHGVDGRLTLTLPDSFLPTLAHRFAAAHQLFMTLDWVQYRAAVYAYNSSVEAAAGRSNELGGLDETKGRLITGLPLFFETVMPARSLPPDIAPQLLYDSQKTALTNFSPKQRVKLKRAAEDAFLSVADRIRSYPNGQIPESDQIDISAAVLSHFSRHVSQDVKLVYRACVQYADQFRMHSNRSLEHHMEQTRRDLRLLEPDAYLLVEGSSDEIYFKGFLQLLTTPSIYLKIEPRGGASTILRRARDLVKDGVGAIVAVVDADASSDYLELSKLLANLQTSDVFIFTTGMIEDQFPGETHAKALNVAFPDGYTVTSSDFDGITGDMVTRLKRVCWEKKRAAFDKVGHAKAIVAMLTTVDDIPNECRQFLERTMAHAEVSAKNRRPTSYLDLDKRTRESVRRFDEATS